MLPKLTLIATLLAAPLGAAPVENPALTARLETPVISPLAVAQSIRPAKRTLVIPKARWGTGGGRVAWTLAALSALRAHAAVLPSIVPRDIADWCPAYPTALIAQREAFWVGLISTLVKHESTYRPNAVGGGGLWYGLTQILPGTARGYGCKARSGAALKNPEDNLSCALRIMAVTVPRDQVISYGMRGVAADWGPFHSRKKREDMARWTRKQSYCTALGRSLRPVTRPAGLGAPDPDNLRAFRPVGRAAAILSSSGTLEDTGAAE